MKRWLLLAVALVALTCRIKVPAGGPSEEGEFPCESSEECPAPPNVCLLSACWDNQCVYVPAPEGMLPQDRQVAGDCKVTWCDGHGELASSTAQRDVPPSDDNPCTHAICDLDVPKQVPRIAGAACDGEGICNGAGRCGVCLPEEQRCDDNALTACTAEGQWSSPEACTGAAPRCHRARCVAVAEIDAGTDQACARFEDGSVMCWGASGDRRLGDSRFASSFVALDVGPRHACGIDASGEVHCWGAGDWGQLGDGRYASRPAPLPVGIRARAVAVGHDHSCALTTEGRVLCWGRNDRGQLGSGVLPAGVVASPRPAASAVGAGSAPAPLVVEGATAIRLDGPQLCVRFEGPHFDCSGDPVFDLPPDLETAEGVEPDAEGALLAARKKLSSPKPLPTLTEATHLDCGDDHCCARLGDASVQCWGAGDRGQLGQKRADSAKPLRVPGLSAAALALGADFTCVIAASAVQCWGDNRRGQLGRGSDQALGDPAPVPLPGLAAELDAGDDFACARTTDGAVSCWGDGSASQVGTPTAIARTPQPVPW